MGNNTKKPGTTGTTGADDLATILSAFGGEHTVVSHAGSSVSWISPRFGRCGGRVDLVSHDGWVAVSLSQCGGLVWIRDGLVSDVYASV